MIRTADLTRQDMHVHSTFSDGANTIEENVAEAARLRLSELTCVDHVRRDSDWVSEYTAEVDRVRRLTDVTLHCAVEAKLLDSAGHLDLPDRLPGVDRIYVADHQFPLPEGPCSPHDVELAIRQGALVPSEVVDLLVAATVAALQRHARLVIAHLFSILPKLGLAETDVPPQLVIRLAEAAAESGASVEIDERWQCPSAATLGPFLACRVPVLLSTDSHRRETIGRYDYCARVVSELEVLRSNPEKV